MAIPATTFWWIIPPWWPWSVAGVEWATELEHFFPQLLGALKSTGILFWKFTIYIYIYINVHIYICIHMCVFIYLLIFINICICICVCTPKYGWIRMNHICSLCMYMYIVITKNGKVIYIYRYLSTLVPIYVSILSALLLLYEQWPNPLLISAWDVLVGAKNGFLKWI